MNDLMQFLQVDSFEKVLNACTQHGETFQDAIDGGAGWGQTASDMCKYIRGNVHAFEPFPGNHRFFANADSRILLHKKALGAQKSESLFHVSHTVSEEDAWGKKGLSGYSSMGKIVKELQSQDDFYVECVRGDDEIPEDAQIDFIKLDLQSGEYPAMRGMGRIFANCKIAWIEFMGDSNILRFLYENNFVVYDTSYVFMGKMRPNIEDDFNITIKAQNSVGLETHKGFRRTGWLNYQQKFAEERQRNTFVQTDFLAVHRNFFPRFQAAMTEHFLR